MKTTTVLAPTQPSSFYQVKPKDLDKEFGELQRMAEADVKFQAGLEPNNVHPQVVYTGYSGGQYADTALSSRIDALVFEPKNTKVHFIVTGHGSPGVQGKIGMGDVAVFDHRLTAAEFVQVLSDAGIKRLKKLDLHFTFRCCNSAYVPLAQWNQDLQKANLSIANDSLIGAFSRSMSRTQRLDVTVIGFRGYYFPDVKGPKLGGKGGKKKFPLADGEVTIKHNGEVEFTDWAKHVKIQDSGLDSLFA